jgi:glutamate synthase domain-containing protein 3
VEGLKQFDLAVTPLREVNRFLHRDAHAAGVRHVKIFNADGAHSIAAGCHAPLDIEVDGHAGYYLGGMNMRANITVHGNAGPGVGENMMSGTIRVAGFASTAAGASAHGGLLVIHGDAALRCGISLKGGDIVVGGSVGSFSAFMAQAGRMVICGDARYEPMSDADYAVVQQLLGAAGLNHPPKEFRRIASAKTLYHWNADANQEY